MQGTCEPYISVFFCIANATRRSRYTRAKPTAPSLSYMWSTRHTTADTLPAASLYYASRLVAHLEYVNFPSLVPTFFELSDWGFKLFRMI